MSSSLFLALDLGTTTLCGRLLDVDGEGAYDIQNPNITIIVIYVALRLP